MSAPLVSIITINYNEVEMTARCLERLRALPYPNVEVFAVDNASAEGQADMLAERFPAVTVIANDTNDGFAGGNNRALRRARGAYVLLLNNDALPAPGLLERLVETMEAHPTVGIASPKIVFAGRTEGSGPPRIQYAGSAPISPYTGRSHTVGYGEPDDGRFDEPGRTHLAHGAAMMIRRSVLEDIGLFYEDYFLYYEEHDFTERAKRAGHTVYYEARATVRHEASTSVGRHSPLKAYYMTRNRLLYLRRNVQGWAFLFSALVYWALAVPKHLLTLLVAGEDERFRATARGAAWHLRHAFDEVQGQPTLSEPPPSRSTPSEESLAPAPSA
jgi:GT2 family glycosyltransferase